MGSILIKNSLAVATLNNDFNVLKGSDIYIEGNEIRDIGRNLKYTADEVIDASGMVLFPGFVNTHHHFFQTLTRNIPLVQDEELFNWLVNLYEVWREITPEGFYISAVVGMAELLLTGCTTSSDHLYLFPEKCPKDLIDYEIKAAKDIGMRFLAVRGSMSLGKSKGGLPPDDVVQNEEEILKDSERLISAYHNTEKFSMLKVALAPCSPFSVTKELMKETSAMANKYGVRAHTHVAETLDEENFCIEKYGKRPIDLMEEVNWLGENFWYAHCVYLNEKEIKLMADTKTGVAHCPTSNLRLGSGIAPIADMINNNVRVGLAVDGSASNDSSNMLQEMRTALFVHRIKSGVKSMPVNRVLRMATTSGANILGWDEIGSIEVGKAADIAIFNLNKIGYAGALSDPIGAVLFSGDTQIAEYTIVNGKVVVRNGKLVNIDENEILKKANLIAEDILEKSIKNTGKDYYKHS